jgi:diguanylate cyclase (GGDEF)-like protein
MKLFLDRNKTLLPRIDEIYLLTRLITLAGVVGFSYYHGAVHDNATLFWAVLATFAAHIAVFWSGMKGHFDLKLAYLGGIVYDLIFIPLAIALAGNMYSSLFFLFFITISVAAYVLTFRFSFGVTATATVLFSLLEVDGLVSLSPLDFGLHLLFLWVYYSAISYVSEYMRKSESRLVKLFNTLNMRTAELERSQAQLEVIYENTRTLGSLLDVDGIIKEVLRIMSQTLRYKYCSIVQRDQWGHFFYRARAVDGRMNLHLKAIKETGNDLISKVASAGEAIRLKETIGRDDYNPLFERARSVMLVPMLAHGHFKGLLLAESNNHDHFSDRDMDQLSSVARSAALAMENAELHRRTEELTMTDELTNTYNYRYFVHKLEEEKKRALRYDLPLSLIMVDIDWFKKINDSYGHEVGNMVLEELSQIIKGCIRDVDIFCRYGGEEFVVILPQTPVREAEQIGERIRSEVETRVMTYEENIRLKITVSVGVSAFPENGRSHEELVSAADQALYQAKGSGKNLVKCV